jgi:hypothetical protein
MSGKGDAGGFDRNDPLRTDQQVDIDGFGARSREGIHALIQPDLPVRDNPPGYPRMLKSHPFTPSSAASRLKPPK